MVLEQVSQALRVGRLLWQQLFWRLNEQGYLLYAVKEGLAIFAFLIGY